jgi:poly(U)-specific endoribonuclease
LLPYRYRRKTDNDSSGFEHVFLGERDADKKSISGLHNWIQVYMEEKAGNLDYKGKIKQRSNYEGNEEFLTIQFEWRGEEKFVSSSLIGTSPEFEMALLSMCFFNGKEDTAVTLGPHQNVNIKCYTIRRKGRTYVGSAYPEKGNNKR